MDVQKIARFFDRYMMYLIGASIVAGVAVGWSAPDFSQRLRIFINLTLFLMLYPMMVGIRVEEILKAAKNIKPISWSLLLNFVVSPLVGYLLVLLAFQRHPDFAVALLLLAVTPCAGMVVGWTGFAKGNVALALVIVALSLTLSIFTIPVTMSLLAHSLMAVNALAMFKGTLLVILVPLVAGDITRRLIIRFGGEKAFAGLRPVLPPLSMLGLFGIIFISTAMGALKIISIWKSIFLIVPVLAIFYLVQFTLAVSALKKAGLHGRDIIAVTYAVSGKNISLALALAAQFFSPLTVVMLAINPLIQMPAMALFLRWSPRLARAEKGSP
jgi:ACR3 family arsenite efflux pump ArsB